MVQKLVYDFRKDYINHVANVHYMHCTHTAWLTFSTKATGLVQVIACMLLAAA